MHRNRQNNDNRRYSYLFPTNLTSAENVHYQYYDSRLRSRPSVYSNAVSRYQPLTPILDVTESISTFNDLKLSRRSRSDLVPCPCTCVSTHLYQQIAVTDRRFVTASSLRERLLTDIQQNIHEIDKELSLLQRRPLPRYLLPPNKKTSVLHNDRQRWSNEPRRMYEVIPHIKRESKIKPKSVPPKISNRVVVHSYAGHYHYGPEIEETEIAENDPENSDPKSAFDQISEFNSYEAISLTRFRREQSLSPQNRALIFIPECFEAKATESNEKTENSHQNNPTADTSQDVASTNKSNIQSSEPLVQTTTAEPKIKTSPPDSVDTVPAKPIKHSTPSTRVIIKTQGEDASSSKKPVTNTEGEDASSPKKPVTNPAPPTKTVTNTEGEDASSSKKPVTKPAASTKPVTNTEREDTSLSKKPVIKPAPPTKPVTNTEGEDASSSKKPVTKPAPPTKPVTNTGGEDASSSKKPVINPTPSTKPVTNTQGEDSSTKKPIINSTPSTKTATKTQGEDGSSSKKPVTNSNPPTKTVTFIQAEDSSSKKTIINSIDTKSTMDGDTVHFFSDFAMIDENDENRILLKPKPVPPPTDSKVNNDTKVSLLEHKLISTNKDENAKKVEPEKDVATKKYSITEISTVPSSTSN